MVLMVLEVILVVLGTVLRQCSEQMFGTDSVRNNVPSQHNLYEAYKTLIRVLLLQYFRGRGVQKKNFPRNLLAIDGSANTLADASNDSGRLQPTYKTLIRLFSIDRSIGSQEKPRLKGLYKTLIR